MVTIAVAGGAGYVGVAYSVLLADLGHNVFSVDTDPSRIMQLNQGKALNHEPGLQPLLEQTLASGRLRFTTDYETAISGLILSSFVLERLVQPQVQPTLQRSPPLPR